MVSSEELYNKFAPHFRSYSKKRRAYIESVNNLILENLPMKRESILDIGCGDGIRGMYLFKKIKGRNMLMIDNSSEMIRLSRKFESQKVKVKKLDISIKKLSLKNQYNIILCLWNVLGHIPKTNQRLTTLKNMRKILKANGRIFIDISNRYNMCHYGFKKVASNIIKDILNHSSKNGDFDYKIIIDQNNELDSTCHFFNPFEMKTLFKNSGLIVEKKYSIDYVTGQIRNTFFGGHLLYILKKLDDTRSSKVQ